MGWRGRREGGSGWGAHVNPWLIHVNVWQKPLQYCKVISLQLIKINGKKERKKRTKQRGREDRRKREFLSWLPVPKDFRIIQKLTVADRLLHTHQAFCHGLYKYKLI